MNETINDSCIICFNCIPSESLCKTNCNHIYCKDCLHTWFNRGNIECPMCRVNVGSYENNGVQNHLIVINRNDNINGNINGNINDNRRLVEVHPNNDILLAMNRKMKLMKIYFCINLIYLGYLQYKNYILWDDCRH